MGKIMKWFTWSDFFKSQKPGILKGVCRVFIFSVSCNKKCMRSTESFLLLLSSKILMCYFVVYFKEILPCILFITGNQFGEFKYKYKCVLYEKDTR